MEMEEKRQVKEVSKDVTGFGVGHFPMSLFVEWDKDCKDNYGDTRWIKIWQDHVVAKQSRKEAAMWDYIMKLNDRLDVVEQTGVEEEPQEEHIATLGNPTPKKKVKKDVE